MLDNHGKPDSGQIIEDKQQALGYIGRAAALLKEARDALDGKIGREDDYKRTGRRYRLALRLHSLLDKDIADDKKRIS